MTSPDTIALFASSRRNGNTGALLDAIAQPLGIEVVDLADKRISPFDYEHRNRDDDFEPLMNHVLGFEQIIFASPIYWYAVAPPMKVFLDRISDYLDVPELLDKGRQLRGKTGFVVCTSVYDTPCAPFIGAFRDTFEYLGMQFGGCMNANCKHGYEPARYATALAGFVRLLKRSMNNTPIPLVLLMAACCGGTHAAEQAPLLAPLENQDRVPGCAWLASAPSLGDGYMFMAEYDDSAAWMNVGGDDIVLELVEERGALQNVADVMERVYRAPGVDVLARYEVTWVCPADTENCEVTRFQASYEVTTADHIQIVAASGAMGC